MKHVGIIGAGLVGSLLANLLSKKGFRVTLFEKRYNPLKTQVYAGRSINLALSERGLKALRLLGLDQELLKLAIPMKARVIHSPSGEISLHPYHPDAKAIYSISRGELNLYLLKKLNQQVALKFNHDLTTWDFQSATFSTPQGMCSYELDYLIGCDGGFSAVRDFIEKDNFDRRPLTHSYKELAIPQDASGNLVFPNEGLHIWPRKSFMFIALPNLDNTFTGTLFLAKEGAPSFNSFNEYEKFDTFFKKEFPDAYKVIPELEMEYSANPVSSLSTTITKKWSKGNTMVIGDAAHAIVPFYGQGMNAGFEDCYILDQMLDKSNGQLTLVFEEFAAKRKKDGVAIAEMALANFIEMRDLITDPAFLLKRTIDNYLYAHHPDKWMSQYAMVTFEDVSYSYAWQKGKEQDDLLNNIIANYGEGWRNNLQDIRTYLAL